MILIDYREENKSMKLATRINSFLQKGKNVIDALNEIGTIEGITHVDLNYPEHFDGNEIEKIEETLNKNNLKVNGLALRFGDAFINGELGNINKKIAEQAKSLCKKAIDLTTKVGGEQLTIWLGHDGFDYSFQINYIEAWKQIVNAFQEIADYDKDMLISIEYKPRQPRAYFLIPDIGTALLLIDEVKRINVGVALDFCHMLMRNENPAYGLTLAAERNKLFGIHLNDGHRLNDDGLMVGTVNFIQTMEFLYYMKKYNYKGVIYFDTFPVREDPVEECKTNIKLLKKYFSLIEIIGMDCIQMIIDENNSIKAQEILLSFLR